MCQKMKNQFRNKRTSSTAQEGRGLIPDSTESMPRYGYDAKIAKEEAVLDLDQNKSKYSSESLEVLYDLAERHGILHYREMSRQKLAELLEQKAQEIS